MGNYLWEFQMLRGLKAKVIDLLTGEAFKYPEEQVWGILFTTIFCIFWAPTHQNPSENSLITTI